MKKFILPSIFLIALILLSGFSSAPAPEKIGNFILNDLSGNPVPLDSYNGKVILLVFFATWCPPCQDELPQLEAIYRKYKAKNFEVVGVNLRESRNSVKVFASENKLSFTILLDEKGEVGSLYKVKYIPRIFIRDRNGEVKFTSHYLPAAEIEKEINKILQ
jgi:thiol-disulfide isomerase/thioredoxin